MGLDQYATTHKHLNEDGSPEGDGHEIARWRKHADLQGWMTELWRKKSLPAENDDFNLTPLRIEAEDLDALEAAVKDGKLPHTEGFFFGSSMPEDTEIDLIFIERARGCIKLGEYVFYDSWW